MASSSSSHRNNDNDTIIPPKPPRPFTEYHIFSQLERNYILQNPSNNNTDDDSKNKNNNSKEDKKEVDTTVTFTDIDPNASARPPKYRNLILPNQWHSKGSRPKCRSHRKNHGKITFVEMTKLISKRWREADSITKCYCRDLSVRELKRYREEMKDYVDRYGAEAGRTKSKTKGGGGSGGKGGNKKSSNGKTTKSVGGGGGGGDNNETMSMTSLLKSKEDLLVQENLNLMLKNQAAMLAASSSTRGGLDNNMNMMPSLAFTQFYASLNNNNSNSNNGFVGCKNLNIANMNTQQQQPSNLANRLQVQVQEEALKLQERMLRCQQQQQPHSSSLNYTNPNMPSTRGQGQVPPSLAALNYSQPPPQTRGRMTMMPQFDFASRAQDHHRMLMEDYRRISDTMMSQEDAAGRGRNREQARMEDYQVANNGRKMMMTMTTLKDQGQLPPLFEDEEYREENYDDFFVAEQRNPQGIFNDNDGNVNDVGRFDDVFAPIESPPTTDLYDDDCSIVGLKSPATIAIAAAIPGPRDEAALASATLGDPSGGDGLRAKSISPVPEYNIAPEISFLAKNFVNEFSRYLNHDHEVQRDELEAIAIDNNQGMGMGGGGGASSNSLMLDHYQGMEKEESNAPDDVDGGGYGDVFTQEKGGYQQSSQGNTIKMGSTSATAAARAKDPSLVENTGTNMMQMFQPYHSTNTPAYAVHTTKKQRSNNTSPDIVDDMSRELSRDDINAWMKDILT